ncbi:MAG: hypothetical protein CFK52_02665 [Chloracidobacterium sp. CP2_5A]|nr:MAG: hypothetical protein CFK52_02665 [Chloracidobacterium sp. CP2_5A]
MPDQPVAKPENKDAERPIGIAAQRQLVFPDAAARDNQVRSRIPLVAEAPVFEFELPPEPPRQVVPQLSRRWRMRLRQLWAKHVVWLVATAALSLIAVAIAAFFSPQPKPPAPPARR